MLVFFATILLIGGGFNLLLSSEEYWVIFPPTSPEAEKNKDYYSKNKKLTRIACGALIVFASMMLFIDADIKKTEKAARIEAQKVAQQKKEAEHQAQIEKHKKETIAYMYKTPQAMKKRENALTKDINETFSEIELSEYTYKFYIDPGVWNYFNYKIKAAVFDEAAEYGALLKGGVDTPEEAYIKTQILDYKNGKTLGSYGFTGLNFK